MDPTAPNNPTSSTPNQAPASPIQPGQFVVAGDSQTAAQPQAAAPISGMSLAQEKPADAPIPPAHPEGQPQNPISAPGMPQPDPTPFATPQQPTANQQATGEKSPGGGSGKKLILILVAVLVLVGIIAAVVVMFILPKTNQTSTTSEIEIEQTAPPPQRTDGGFGQIPQSTESGLPAEEIPPAPIDNPTTGL